MKRLTLATIAVVGLAGVAMGMAALWPQSQSAITVEQRVELQTASFMVENMTCATCPITVRRAMTGVDGVHDVLIDYEAKTATARFDPARATISVIATASTDAGYPAHQVNAGRL